MKRIAAVGLALCGFTGFSVQAKAGDLEDSRFYIAPALAYSFLDNKKVTTAPGIKDHPDDDLGYQLSIGKPITSHFNLELVGSTLNTRFNNPASGKYDLDSYGATLLLFPNRDAYPIFGILSAAKTDFKFAGRKEDGSLYDVGIGATRQIFASGTSLRWEYRYRFNNAKNTNFNDHVVTLGLQIPIGPAPVPPPPPPPPPAPPPPPVVEAPEPPAPPPPEVSTTAPIELKGVNFEFDSAKLTPEAQTILNGVVDALKGAPEVKTLIKGHTDSTGPSQYNLGLSKRRAASVKDYLIKDGIDGGRLETKGYGESQPVTTNATREGRAQNRRVELDVIDDNSCIAPTVGDQIDEKGCAIKTP